MALPALAASSQLAAKSPFLPLGNLGAESDWGGGVGGGRESPGVGSRFFRDGKERNMDQLCPSSEGPLVWLPRLQCRLLKREPETTPSGAGAAPEESPGPGWRGSALNMVLRRGAGGDRSRVALAAPLLPCPPRFPPHPTLLCFAGKSCCRRPSPHCPFGGGGGESWHLVRDEPGASESRIFAACGLLGGFQVSTVWDKTE